MEQDTIAAIASGMTTSGIGVIRISGADAISITDRVYRSSLDSEKTQKKLNDYPTHTIHYGYICDREEVIDEVMVLLMRAPHSYTKEDCVEIDCHGGVYVMRRLLETVLKYGARPAEPGEFTKRAFLNGRIDLTQAESVMDLISSKNEYAMQNSLTQLRGNLGDQIRQMRADLLYQIAYIESALDDPEHISLDGFAEQLQEQVSNLIEQMQQLLRSFDNGRFLKEGIRTVILGKPNAGKSSLLNLLAGMERAIVTDVAGTTRDTLEEDVYLDGIVLTLIDTAGIRNAQDQVEQIGVSRARKEAETADLILYVMDSSTQPDENDREIAEFIRNRKAIVLLNKSDLPAQTMVEDAQQLTGKEVILFSAQTQEGLAELKEAISKMFFDGQLVFNDQVMLTNVRQKNSLQEACHALECVMESIQNGMPEDFYSIDLMDAYTRLGTIIGEAVEDDVAEEIFSKFCIGK